MSWKPKEIEALRSLVVVYLLPGGCWAVFNVKNRLIPETEKMFLPEGVEYSWAILMPGFFPLLRGDRMAGVDNADDAAVRVESQKSPSGPQHRAHKHKPDWKRMKTVAGQEWPLSGNGKRLVEAPSSAGDLWIECMRCLEDLFEGLGIRVPTFEKLLEGKTTEETFRLMQKNLKVKTQK